MIDVCLPLLPFARLEAPSLALGILKSSVQQAGLSCKVLYPNLDFAIQIGIHNYQFLSIESISLLGEWAFSRKLFGINALSHHDYFDYIRRLPHCFIEPDDDLLRLQDYAALFIDTLAKQVVSLNPRILSCTSTFQQHCASLALLKTVKSIDQSIITVMGGANCEGVMGFTTHRLFPFVDYVFSGEGDFAFAEFCRSMCSAPPLSGSPPSIPELGLFHAASDPSSINQRTTVPDLDQIPIPDYDDYFGALEQHPIAPMIRPSLPVEASRGCWWGQKQHCTFCGLNGDGMAYRFKNPDRLLLELDLLTSRYGNYPLGFVDNILPSSYFESSFSSNSSSFAGLKRKYFFEVKANLSKQQVQQLSASGVTWIQPGLESLHDEALKLMKKGTTVLINLQLLRWCLEVGMRVSWSVLTEFPGEQISWLIDMAALMPLIHHLQPPSALLSIQYHRFSPYFREAPAYGLNLSLAHAYRHIYPFDSSDIAQLVFNFDDQRTFAQAYCGSFRSPEGQSLHLQI